MALLGLLQSTIVTFLVFAILIRIVAYLLREYQANLLYHPDHPPHSREEVPHPEEYGLRNYEVLEIPTSDGVVLHSYFIAGGAIPAVPPITVIHFHGNAGNIGHRLPLAHRLQAAMRCNVVLAEYRGYGASQNAPVTEEGLRLDAQSTLDHVRSLPYVNPNGIVVYGTSLGGAVGIELASSPANEKKISALVVENSFTNISDMVDVLFASILSQVEIGTHRRKAVLKWVCLRLLKPLVLMLRWRSIDAVGKVKVPTLFLSGELDELVPPEHMARLYNHCRAPIRQLVTIADGTHNDTWLRAEHGAAFNHFLQQHVADKLDFNMHPEAGVAHSRGAAPTDISRAIRGAGAQTMAQHLEIGRGKVSF